MFSLFSSSTSPSKPTFASLQDEVSALQDALSAGTHIINDDYDLAEAKLVNVDSPFHMLGLAVVAFLRAALGNEQELIKAALIQLAASDSVAADYRQRAQVEDPFTSQVHPAGSQYALCQAHISIMTAIVTVLSGSITESAKCFLKVRKAYLVLQDIANAEQRFIEARACLPSPDSRHDSVTSLSLSDNHKQDTADVTTLFAHPIDSFVHSGTNLCFGGIQVVLAILPPNLIRMASIVGFKGDSEYGLRMLWRASIADDVHGAMASVVLINYYNLLRGTCSILAPEAFPHERCESTLAIMKQRYPRCRIMRLEEARMLAHSGRIEESVEFLGTGKPSQVKQLESQVIFVRAIKCMYLHRYQDCAAGFLECMELNSWSHGLYTYVAGCCYFELHRIATLSSDPRAQEYADRATELLESVPAKAGRKTLFSRRIPMDIFVSRKVAKWQARAAARKVPLIQAVGTTPIQEMMLVFHGYDVMGPTHLSASLARLEQEDLCGETVDEQCMHHVLKATVLSRLGRFDQARTLLTSQVLNRGPRELNSAANADKWPLPAAHFELGVIAWKEANLLVETDPDAHAQKLRDCAASIDKVANWSGDYDLAGSMSMAIRVAQRTLAASGL